MNQELIIPNWLKAKAKFDHSRQFLKLLDPHAESFTFQTFDDNKMRKDGRLAQVINGKFDDVSEALESAQKNGAGVFVTVQQTDLMGRKNGNIQRVRAIFQEDDDGYQGEFPLEPHIVVESSSGKFHRYWLVDGLSFEEFDGIMQTMVRQYGSDKNATGIARVLRLPGFLHQKDEPFMVRIVHESGAAPYTRDELLKGFLFTRSTRTASIDTTKHLTMEQQIIIRDLAAHAARRTVEDETLSRNREIFDLGGRIRRDLGWSATARRDDVLLAVAATALPVFDHNMRKTNTSGKVARMNVKVETNTILRGLRSNQAVPDWEHTNSQMDESGLSPPIRTPRAGSLESLQWTDPLPIPDHLSPVPAFDITLLPEAIRAWVADISERMQCPPDFTAVGAVVALSSVIGRKRIILPKKYDNWAVVPNLWGVVVGRPGVMKSPALAEVMKPLDQLAYAANEDYRSKMTDFDATQMIAKMNRDIAEAEAKKLLKSENPASAKALLMGAPSVEENPPSRKRYKVTDATVEALAEILEGNHAGVLVYRDEIHGLLTSMDREGQESARSFYLQGYDGNQSWTTDRIGRGKHRNIPAVCLSMLGGIQPGKLRSYIRDAVRGGAGDDGLLQRFGLLVWPDGSGDWKNVDRRPDEEALREAVAVFNRLDALTLDDNGQPIAMRFTEEAQVNFDNWRGQLEILLRGDYLHPAIESHLAKYRKLVPALALIFALVKGDDNAVDADSLSKAIIWSEYLRSHAERAYQAGQQTDTQSAIALLKKIREGAVEDGFGVRTIRRKGWAGLNTKEDAQAAVDLLCDHKYLQCREIKSEQGGRPTAVYHINQKI